MRHSLGLFLLVILFGIISSCSALQNGSYPDVTSTKNITIDPIGNHTVDEIFFINGTTTIDSHDSLEIAVYNAMYNPGGRVSGFRTTLPIRTGREGMNYWSCNASTVPEIWSSVSPPGPGPEFPFTGEYIIQVSSTGDPDVSAARLFYVVPNGSTIVRPTSLSTEEITLSPHIPPPATTVSPLPSNAPTTTAGMPLFQVALLVIVGLAGGRHLKNHRR